MDESEKKANEFLMGLGHRADAEGDEMLANSYFSAGLRVKYADLFAGIDKRIAAAVSPRMAMVTAHCFGQVLECSRCGAGAATDWNFCPHCGAVFINERDPETGEMSDVPQGGACGFFSVEEEPESAESGE